MDKLTEAIELTVIYTFEDESDVFFVFALPSGEFQTRVHFENGEVGELGTFKTKGAAMMSLMVQFMHDNQHAFEHEVGGRYVNNFEEVLKHVEKGAQIVQDLEADIKARGLTVV